jgi:hypothetical protein
MSSWRPNLQRGLCQKYIVRILAFSLSIFYSNTCKCVTSATTSPATIWKKVFWTLKTLDIIEQHNYLALCNKTRRFNTFSTESTIGHDNSIHLPSSQHISFCVIIMLFSIPMVFQVDMTRKAFSSEFCIHVLPPP